MTITHDTACLDAITLSPNMLVPWYLMASYLYYHRDEPIITDGLFDQITKRLDAEWDNITHRHLSVVRRDELSAGTCLRQAYDFPLITRSAACRLAGIDFLGETDGSERKKTKGSKRSRKTDDEAPSDEDESVDVNTPEAAFSVDVTSE